MPIKDGNKIKVEYTGTLEDKTVFDTSVGKEPLEFVVGSGQLIAGFDTGVLGMEKGEEKEIKLQSADAYGEPNPQLIQKIPREKLPLDQEPVPGMVIAVSFPNGQQMPAKIMDVDDKEITIDLNHPLAGKILNFKIKIIEISS